jgi:hypothetical protein
LQKNPSNFSAQFEKGQSITVAGSGSEVVSVYLVDMNGDKLIDIVVVVRNSTDSTISILAALQKSDKTFPGKKKMLTPR